MPNAPMQRELRTRIRCGAREHHQTSRIRIELWESRHDKPCGRRRGRKPFRRWAIA
ncbi:MAG: hypothetical protein OXN97_10150 [Bryobacterales bacterium]|nr:hypothetical protein [Bryobacterales bacterium]